MSHNVIFSYAAPLVNKPDLKEDNIAMLRVISAETAEGKVEPIKLPAATILCTICSSSCNVQHIDYQKLYTIGSIELKVSTQLQALGSITPSDQFHVSLCFAAILEDQPKDLKKIQKREDWLK